MSYLRQRIRPVVGTDTQHSSHTDCASRHTHIRPSAIKPQAPSPHAGICPISASSDRETRLRERKSVRKNLTLLSKGYCVRPYLSPGDASFHQTRSSHPINLFAPFSLSRSFLLRSSLHSLLLTLYSELDQPFPSLHLPYPLSLILVQVSAYRSARWT